VAARNLKTASGRFGYLRLWTFDVARTNVFVQEVGRLLKRLSRDGLIIDLRSNPGGYIDTAESLLQLFTAADVQPARFACRATEALAQLAEADGNGPELADWAGSTRNALELGEYYSQHLPISDPEAINKSRWFYPGPVVAIVDPNTFSCGDLFAAGIVDHGIGTIVATGEATGAGGANVWYSDDIACAYHAAKRPLPPLPPGFSYSIAVRRMVRTGPSAGRAVEDIGISGDDHYTMTRRDLLEDNTDLAEYCGQLLERM
jgi:C-terminal processing protease CtpA/Prc